MRARAPRVRVGAVACSLLALAAVACDDGRTDLDRAREAADINDRGRAIGFYQRHLAEAPDDFDVRLEYTLLLGEAWAYSGGDGQPIIDNLELLYAEQPGNLRVKELYAMMLVRDAQAAAETRRYESAEQLLRQAVDIHPDVGTAHYHLGVLYQDLGRSEEAFQALVAAALKRPPIPDLYLRLGIEYLARDELDRAINTLELVQELRGTSTYLLPRAHCALAQAHDRRGDSVRAAVHLESAGRDCQVG